MSWQFFSHYPIFRILLPFIAGILINEQLCPLPFVLIMAAVAIVVYAFFGLRLKNNPNRWNYRHLYFAPITLLALSCGAFSQYLNRPKQIDLATIENNLIVGRVNEIKYNEFSMSLKISVMSKVNPETKKVESLPVFPMILTTQGCDYTLKAGDVLIFDGEVKPITNLGNPDEMDYASYMRNNGVLYCCHTPMEKVLKIDNNPTLANSLTNLRYSLRHIIMNSSLSPPTRTFLLAILIGDDDYIDHTTREQFSNAGISHILALSGLHVGIISFIIWLLLFPLDYYHKRKLRLLLTIVALWFFAFFTGLSPSVLRATVMTTVVFGAFIFYRGQKALNSLGLAALIILVFNPLAIHQVGFQFSFITVAAIIIIYPIIAFVSPKHKFWYYVYSSVAVSVIALVATAPLSAYYFSSVSFHSIVANIIVLPIMPLFMLLGVVYVFLVAVDVNFDFLAQILDFIYSIIEGVTQVSQSVGVGRMNYVYITPAGVILYYIIISSIVVFISQKKFKWLLMAMAVFAIALIHSLWVDVKTPKSGLIVFNSYNSTPILAFNKGNATLWTPDDDTATGEQFMLRHKKFIAHYKINSLVVTCESLSNDDNYVHSPFALLNGTKMAVIGNKETVKPVTSSPITLDLLILNRANKGVYKALESNFKCDKIIVSGRIHENSLPAIDSITRINGKTTHFVARSGAYTVFE